MARGGTVHELRLRAPNSCSSPVRPHVHNTNPKIKFGISRWPPQSVIPQGPDASEPGALVTALVACPWSLVCVVI